MMSLELNGQGKKKRFIKPVAEPVMSWVQCDKCSRWHTVSEEMMLEAERTAKKLVCPMITPGAMCGDELAIEDDVEVCCPSAVLECRYTAVQWCTGYRDTAVQWCTGYGDAWAQRSSGRERTGVNEWHSGTGGAG